jgi:acetoin utilization deacetylase AcuC-like enzyme
MATLLLTDERMMRHLTGPHHPESPSRLAAALRGLDPLPPGAELRSRCGEATREQLTRVHEPAYVDRVLALRGRAGMIDHETPLSEGSVEAALLAAGGSIELIDALLNGSADNGFALVRPPGHHAESNQGMGFCTFNNLAVAAAHALSRGVRRILVVDWDVHHGNGTQEIFYRRPELLFISLHQENLFPATGSANERGEALGEGATLNAPLPPGTGDDAYVSIWREQLRPRAEEFRPELVLVSAGFDAHVQDLMSQLQLSTGAYSTLCLEMKQLAQRHAGGKLGLFLEGGYDLASLEQSVRACVDVLTH